jgi:alcohol dehydrogenase class IV
MSRGNFRAAGFPWRLYCGQAALEAGLAESLDRAGAQRAFVICSPSIAARTSTVARIRAALGARCVGVFDGIEKDSTYASVCAARDAARAAGADLLVAVGGGSVLVAVRAVAILLGESADPYTLMTQYPEGKPAFSPRLLAPKLPIINIPTTPTSAMNRAGTGLKNPTLDHRMEFFDPKTRPQAVILDDEALGATPPAMLRSTATTVFASLVGAMAQQEINPLAQADRDHAFRLAHHSTLRLAAGEDDAALRRDLALAAFLQNRAEDDGHRSFRSAAFSGNYAVSTALHVRFPQVGQGESTAVVHAAKIRLSLPAEAIAARAVAAALGLWREGMAADAAALAVADWLEALYPRLGMPVRLRDLGIARAELAEVAAMTVKNFNANAGLRSGDQVADALRLLEAAY